MDKLEIKKIRLKLNLQQKEFAFVMNVSETTIVNWEKGHNKPSPKKEYGLECLKQLTEVY